jgi:NAD(P)H-dependent FMN reductase
LKQLLAISGSLRSRSSNTVILQCLEQMAAPGARFVWYNGLEQLPHFNPDADNEQPPAAVQAFRQQLRQADGVVFCTPEYAHGIPGALKDALDWLVSSGEFTSKPTAVISASPLATGGEKAQAALLTTIRVMGAIVPEACSLQIPFVYKKFNEAGAVTDEPTRQALEDLMKGLLQSIAAVHNAATGAA